MNSALRTLPLSILAIALLFPLPATAETLEELLGSKVKTSSLTDEKANEAWKAVVDAFRKNDMPNAVRLGNHFLSGDFKPSPYQLLGVKVMIGLANGGTGAQQLFDPETADEKKRLESEGAAITARYQQLRLIYQQADARINEITLNRRRPVQEGTANYYECVRSAKTMDDAKAELDKLAGPLELNKKKLNELESKAGSSLKSTTLRLLDMLLEADEIEAAFAISNTYIRRIGNDLEIARKQQDVVRLQEVSEKATKVVTLLSKDLKPFIDAHQYWEAKDTSERFVKRVSQEAADPDLIRLVKAKVSLDEYGIDRAIQQALTDETSIERLAKTDYRKAEALFKVFRETHPDYPKMQELLVLLMQCRTQQMSKKLPELIAELEVLAESDPQRALEVIPVIGDSDFDPIDRARLELRIKNINSKVISNLVRKLATDLHEIRDSLDPKTMQISAESPQGKASLQAGVKASDPKVSKARIKGVEATVAALEQLATSDEQRAEISSVKAEVVSLDGSIH